MTKKWTKVLGTYRGTIYPGSKPVVFSSTEVGEITSVGHRGWRSGSGDTGGPFFLSKVSDIFTPGLSTYGQYLGQYAPIQDRGNTWNSGFPSNAPVNDITLSANGTTALARSLPTNPSAGLAQFLGELREGAPRAFGASITRSNCLKFKQAGDEYLNYQFGWVPFVSDLRKFAYAIKHRNKIIQSYQRGSDKKIRRRYEFPVLEYNNGSNGSVSQIATGASSIPITGPFTKSYKRLMWFEGAFRYHVPVGDSFVDKALRYESYANKLLGARLTPELVWELTPWSWLADWMGNTGDVMHNISTLGRDGLVMQYGYIMCHTRIQSGLYTTASPFPQVKPGASRVLTRDFKQRLPATPFGFGVNLNALTSKQVAILAALGLSRGGKPWNQRS